MCSWINRSAPIDLDRPASTPTTFDWDAFSDRSLAILRRSDPAGCGYTQREVAQHLHKSLSWVKARMRELRHEMLAVIER